MKGKTIKINATTIKEALAEYFNNQDANMELEGKDFKLNSDINRKRYWAERKETVYEVCEIDGFDEEEFETVSEASARWDE